MRSNCPLARRVSIWYTMRHKYDTRGIVLARTPSGETSATVSVLTRELGLLRARASGVRKSGAKLAAALSTFAESELILVRGRDGWRITGAVLLEPWRARLGREARERAGRVAALILRLATGESPDTALFTTLTAFLAALVEGGEIGEPAEVLAALYALSALGFSDTTPPSAAGEFFARERLAEVEHDRVKYIARVNQGIAASGL